MVKGKPVDAPVIVVGAGPSGLMLAAELRLGGAGVIVLERLAERTGESRGLGLFIRTMEVFDQRGLLPRFGNPETSSLGHFGGIPLDFSVLGNPHLANRTVPQSQTETVLEEWAAELGADIRRGHDVKSVRQDADGVDVEVAGPDGTVRTLRCQYLVGCDGGRSRVRKQCGFDFPGVEGTMEMFQVDLKGIEMRPREIGEKVPGGMVMGGPLGDGVFRITICERDNPPKKRTEPVTFAEAAGAWKRLTGEDISAATPVWIGAFTDATRLVSEYRRGRVLLAGDAAHIHLPAGGQGMNTSIQDAVNLGWKLAAVVRGTSPESLLDTYHSERHPVGERLTMNTRAQALLFLRGEEMLPLRKVMAELVEYPEVHRHLARMVSGLAVRYDVGEGGHPLLGERMPHVELITADGKTSTTELMRPARGVLIDCADDAGLRQVAEAWSDRVNVITASPHDGADPAGPLHGTAAVLLRPDSHVAWTPESRDDLATALERWFGPKETP
ncbi:FAD-dependent monooxygenase [Kibdelosporangium persicum]|uniref:Auricin polyketide oxiygenase n=1 Tax=Kibdelosporangium persicum TaxID=2698649 RepID=A0ABX2F7D6_9PSEU|nr:FAD-dependent monooxygenase [Kibdelosporangium persicum]NRN67227.1 Auricin polyketide oxiygenase [Kibdelosporangium persicum]